MQWILVTLKNRMMANADRTTIAEVADNVVLTINVQVILCVPMMLRKRTFVMSMKRSTKTDRVDARVTVSAKVIAFARLFNVPDIHTVMMMMSIVP